MWCQWRYSIKPRCLPLAPAPGHLSALSGHRCALITRGWSDEWPQQRSQLKPASGPGQLYREEAARYSWEMQKLPHCLETITTIIPWRTLALQLICMGNAKSLSPEKSIVSMQCQSGVRDGVWVISWGLQFVWIIIRSITVNTSSDGVFTRNKTQSSSCSISWVMVVIILLDHFSHFFQRSPFPPALYSERFSVTFSISPILVIGCLLIININCVVRCECLGPPAPCPCPVNYRT